MAVKDTIFAALQKGDAGDPAFRETIYRQVFAAFERSIENNQNLTADEIYRRREVIISVISEIERTYAVDDSLNVVPESTNPTAPRVVVSDDFPSISLDERLAPAPVQHRYDDGLGKPVQKNKTDIKKQKQKRRSVLLPLLTMLILLIIIMGGGLWFLKSDLSKSLIDEVGQIIENSSEPLGEGGLLPQRTNTAWLEVIKPEDLNAISSSNGAIADIGIDSSGSYIRIGSGQRRAPVVFEVGQGLLERFAGQNVTFNIDARALEGAETQISVTCDLGNMGTCGRLRYGLGANYAEYLFEVQLAPNTPRSGGTISIVADIEGNGRMVDIRSITASAN